MRYRQRPGQTKRLDKPTAIRICVTAPVLGDLIYIAPRVPGTTWERPDGAKKVRPYAGQQMPVVLPFDDIDSIAIEQVRRKQDPVLDTADVEF